MNKNVKKIIDALVEWENVICDESCEDCILNQDVECTNEFTTDYCTMLNHLAKALMRTMSDK